MDEVQFQQLLSAIDSLHDVVSYGLSLFKVCVGFGFGLLFGWNVLRDVFK